MKIFKVFLFLLTNYLIKCSAATTISSNQTDHHLTILPMIDDHFKLEYKESESNKDSKYLLPQISVLSEGGNHTTSLARLLDFYNTEMLATNWERTKSSITSNCRKDMELYLRGLSKPEKWALKMDDASGRYSTGWFWGNHFWAGSQSFCDNIVPQGKSIVINSENRTRISREAGFPSPAKPSTSAINQSPPRYESAEMGVYESVPPFPISFFMMRLNLNSSFATETLIHLGLCMPYVCTDSDVKNIMEITSKASNQLAVVHVEAVKSHHNWYTIWKDTTFQVLCGVTCFMIGLLIIGTCYDFYLENEKKKNLLAVTRNHLQMDLGAACDDSKQKNGVYLINGSNNNNNNKIEPLNISSSSRRSNPTNYVARFICKELVLAFSLRANIKTICDQSVSADTIPVLHGLKTISMAWVVLGHTCIIAYKYSDNMEYRKVVQREFFFQTITNSTFSVDTFFFTSGLLVAFLYFRTNAKGKLDPLTQGTHGFIAGTLHFFGLILYRFARLTVPYLFALGVVEVSMKWFHYNSIFEPPTMDHVNCPNYWWRNILYINTLFPVNEMCMLWSWYLSDDTQFYIIGAVILILGTKHFKSAACLLLVFMTSSWITTAYIAFSNSHVPGSDDPLALFDEIYDKPWTRLSPYLIGMCAGWFLFKKNCQIHMSKLTVIAGWTASTACLLWIIYGLYNMNLTPLAGAAYSSLSHSAWAISLAWIVIACSTGYGGVANQVLSATILYPFSRVTYCAYLIHPVVIRTMTMSMDSPLHLGSLVMIIMFLGQLVASYSISFFVSLTFEAPIVSMLRIMQKVVVLRRKLKNQQSPA